VKKILLTLLTVLIPSFAAAWTVADMNMTINSANFIVDGKCSGTLVSLEHRLVLTNHHCIGGGVKRVTREIVGPDGAVSKREMEELRDLDVSQRSYVRNRLVGEATYKAQIVAKWQESDLALLQIRADIPNAIAAQVFSGEEVIRGETAYVVGNPLLLDATVTKGVVSSVNRMFRVPWANNAEVPFIQVDAGITGGNSGGALYNEAGVLIGVPAAGVPGTVVGLAIPYFQIQEFLTANCYGSVWDASAVSHDACVAAKTAVAEAEK
jgi:S1-C subfamily serine protease